MPASWKVAVDWTPDGDFADPYEDVTSRTLDGRTPVTMTYGRDQNRALSPPRVGEAGFELNNADRLFSPEYTASPLYGLVIPGREVRIQATLSGTTYTPFRGQLDDFTLKPGVGQRSIDVTCLDGLSKLRGIPLTTPLYRGLRTGEALHVLLDAAGWPDYARDIDAGATVMPLWWLDNTDAFDAALDLLDTEGPYALITMDNTGRIVFRDRHHRVTRSASLTVQSTWRSSGIEPLISAPADYDHGWKEIINAVTFEVPLYAAPETQQVVWSSPDRIRIPSGETVSVTVKGTALFYDAVLPVANVDYTATGVVTMTMPRTSGESTTVFITAPSGVAYVDGLQVRGRLITVSSSAVVSGEDPSITRYGRRTSPSLRNPKWAGVHDTRAIIELILAQRAERLPTIRVAMVAATATRQTQQLSRNLSDRVHVVEPDTGLDADCWIEQISHTVTQGGLEHRTVFGLEKAPTQVTNALVLGSATAGILGTNRLGRRGFAQPDSIFILGSATNGVLGADILAA